MSGVGFKGSMVMKGMSSGGFKGKSDMFVNVERWMEDLSFMKGGVSISWMEDLSFIKGNVERWMEDLSLVKGGSSSGWVKEVSSDPRSELEELFFPNPRRWILRALPLFSPSKTRDEGAKFRAEKPVYSPEYIKPDAAPGWVYEEKTIRISSFFNCPYLETKHGLQEVSVDSLTAQGQSLLIACFFVPYLSYHAESCRALITLSEELSHKGLLNTSYRIIIVVKLRHAWASDDVAYRRFVKGFPDTFLFVPYVKPASCDYIAHALALQPLEMCSSLFVGPGGEVSSENPDFRLRWYGAAAFPPTVNINQLFVRQDQQFLHSLDYFCREFKYPPRSANDVSSQLSLAEILNCKPQDKPLLRFRGLHDFETASVSQLDGKMVALYLCSEGSLMEKLHDLQQQYKNCEPKLEVVLVPLAFKDDPSLFHQHVAIALDKLQISSWWILPYNDRICRTLWRLSNARESDTLIILPFGGSYCGETKAHVIIDRFGSSVYPFTRQMMYSAKLSALSQVTFQSLLGEFQYVLTNGRPVAVEPLLGKKILLCLDRLDFSGGPSEIVLEHISEIQSAHPDVVIACLATSENPDKKLVSQQSLYMLPHQVAESAMKALFVEDLGECREYDTIISFGENGHILSREIYQLLQQGDYKSLFKYSLPKEITRGVVRYVDTFADMVM